MILMLADDHHGNRLVVSTMIRIGNDVQHRVYLSYVRSDEQYAERFRKLLLEENIEAFDVPRESTDVAQAESHLTSCTVIVVLLGQQTQFSRWVDMEIALATEPRIGSPGAGLLGVILDRHVDFDKPYYEPDNIPLRLHDRVRWEYAIVKKWSDSSSDIRGWLDTADRRRYHYKPSVSYKVRQELKEFCWNDEIDEPRPAVQLLAEREE